MSKRTGAQVNFPGLTLELQSHAASGTCKDLGKLAPIPIRQMTLSGAVGYRLPHNRRLQMNFAIRTALHIHNPGPHERVAIAARVHLAGASVLYSTLQNRS